MYRVTEYARLTKQTMLSPVSTVHLLFLLSLFPTHSTSCEFLVTELGESAAL